MKTSLLKVGRLWSGLAVSRRGISQRADKSIGVIGAPFGMGQVGMK